MSINTDEWLASVASVATNGQIEIFSRDPFAGRADGIYLQSFYFERAELTTLDLTVPVAPVDPGPSLERWVSRISPRLFNVHVAIHEVNDMTIVEARSTLIADGLTVETLRQGLFLLALGAEAVAADLRAQHGGAIVTVELAQPAQELPAPPFTAPSDEPARETHPPVAPVVAGYL